MQLRSLPLSISCLLFAAASGACVAVDGDAESDQAAALGVTPSVSAFVLTVSASAESDVDVSSATSFNTCLGGTTCNFAFLQGTALTLHTQAQNLVDCAQFSRWDGACAGQGTTCSLVINSDLSTTSRYKFGIPGCRPQ